MVENVEDGQAQKVKTIFHQTGCHYQILPAQLACPLLELTMA